MGERGEVERKNGEVAGVLVGMPGMRPDVDYIECRRSMNVLRCVPSENESSVGSRGGKVLQYTSRYTCRRQTLMTNYIW